MTPPKYYDTAFSPLDFIMANNLDFIRGNIVKYAVRAGNKGGKEEGIADCNKIIAYATKLKESFEAED